MDAAVEKVQQAGEAWVRDGTYPEEHDTYYSTRS